MTTKIDIYRDDIWAGTGRIHHGQIVDCPADLGSGDQDASDLTYDLLDQAIADGDSQVVRPDGVYTWITSES